MPAEHPPRRALFAALALAVAAALLWLAWRAMAPGGWTVWEALAFACFAGTVPWTALCAANALAGFAVLMAARDPPAAVLPALRRARVSAPYFRVLAALRDAPPEGETVTGLAGLCLLMQPTMTKLVDRMERDGLAARRTDPRDRRVVRVVLSVAGVLLADRLVALAERHEREVLERFPALAAAGLPGVLAAMVGRDGS